MKNIVCCNYEATNYGIMYIPDLQIKAINFPMKNCISRDQINRINVYGITITGDSEREQTLIISCLFERNKIKNRRYVHINRNFFTIFI